MKQHICLLHYKHLIYPMEPCRSGKKAQLSYFFITLCTQGLERVCSARCQDIESLLNEILPFLPDPLFLQSLNFVTGQLPYCSPHFSHISFKSPLLKTLFSFLQEKNSCILIDAHKQIPLIWQTCLGMNSRSRIDLSLGGNLCYNKRHVTGKLFPSLCLHTKTFLVCVLDTGHAPLHILSTSPSPAVTACGTEFHVVFVQFPMGVI